MVTTKSWSKLQSCMRGLLLKGGADLALGRITHGMNGSEPGDRQLYPVWSQSGPQKKHTTYSSPT